MAGLFCFGHQADCEFLFFSWLLGESPSFPGSLSLPAASTGQACISLFGQRILKTSIKSEYIDLPLVYSLKYLGCASSYPSQSSSAITLLKRLPFIHSYYNTYICSSNLTFNSKCFILCWTSSFSLITLFT